MNIFETSWLAFSLLIESQMNIMSILDFSDIEFDINVPVAIIGAGAAGLVAALSLNDSGIRSLVLEREKIPSGSTALSSGMIPAAGTKIQTKQGIIDSAELLFADVMAKARGNVNREILTSICKISGPTIDWLMGKHGINLSLVDGFLYPGHSRLRMHAPVSRQGTDLIGNLTTAAANVGIDLLTEAYVKDLFCDGPKVKGLRLKRPDGSHETVGCNALILACNGFGGNPGMILKHIPEMADAIYFGHPGNQGDALNWGIQLGAEIRDLGSFQGHGSVAQPHGILITWALMTEGGILVNASGRRFTNEHEGYSEQAKRVLAQKHGLAWNIYDHRLHLLGLDFGEYREANKLGAIKCASTIAELAGILGLPETALTATMIECTQLSKGTITDQFKRNFTTKPNLTPPYYGIQVTGALFHTQGGLVINNQAYVLQKNGQSFPNLFAAGGAAAGISGPEDWGYLSGNGLLSAVSLGRLAGLASADLVQGNI
jgi:fumarate reductase flavoprotein subunit